MADQRIAVLGAGANGASIGADLTRAGLDVTLVEQWPAHVEAMREHGVRIEVDGDVVTTPVHAMHLCEVATLRQPFDVVLVLMKAYDTRWAVELIAPHLAADGVVAGVQNGMSADVIAEVVGAERAMGCVIEISSTMVEPGVVHRHSGFARSWFAVGALDDAARAHEGRVAELLGNSGTVALVDDILATKWMKLVSNATTLVTTASAGLPMLDALEQPGLRKLMLRSGQEALDVGVAQGFPILPIFGLTPDDVADPATVVETLLDTLYRGFVVPGATTTVLQDWSKGRHSEVDDLNGEVVRRGGAHGVPTPVNRAVVEVAHRIERGDLEAGPAGMALLRELTGA